MNDAEPHIGILAEELTKAGPRRICDVCKKEFAPTMAKQMYCLKEECQAVKKSVRERRHFRPSEERQKVSIPYVDANGEWIWRVNPNPLHPKLIQFREWRRGETLNRWITKWLSHYPV